MKKFDILKNDFLEFLKYDKGYSERTIENYKRDKNRYMNRYIKHVDINGVDVDL